MSIRNLSKEVFPKLVQAPLASGGTDLASKYVDMMNYPGGVTFIGILGTAGSTDVCTLQVWLSASTATTGHASTTLTMTTTAGESDKLMILDVVKPIPRYVKTHFTRSAAVEYGGTVALAYGAHKQPVSSTGTDLVSTPVTHAGST